MGKYQLNENPVGKSVVPIIELQPGQAGVISHVGIYDDHPFIYPSSGGDRRVNEVNPIHYSVALANLTDNALMDIAKERRLPLDELAEIRDLEKEYKNRVASAAKPSA